jgi:hypothetical protein
MNNKTAMGFGVLLVGLLGVVASQRTAHAGANAINGAVSITYNSDATGTAMGAMGVARNNTLDSSGMVNCSIHENGPSGVYWGCYAQNARGSASCALDMTDDQYVRGFIYLTALLNPDSFIKFQWKTVNGSRVCTIIRIENDSRYAPKGA